MRVFLLVAILSIFAWSRAGNSTAGADAKPVSTTESVPYSFGIDISRYQHINWEKLDSNINFIICKATEGTKLIDPKFAFYWQNIHPRIKKGAYHFFRPYCSGEEQAKLFLSVVNFSQGHLLPVIDVEYSRAYSRMKPAVAAKQLKQMIFYIEKVLCVKPIIYTTASFWNKQFSPFFKDMSNDCHLWIADYRLREDPAIPKGWNDWSIWQHSCKGMVSGILNEVDLNICKVDLEQLTIPE